MADNKTRNALAVSGPRTSNHAAVKDAIVGMKYLMSKPLPVVYPFDDKLLRKTYPDYSPWEEENDMNKKLDNLNYLNKGYFESSKVSNEYYSARTLVQETVFSSSHNCNQILRELSQHLTKSYKTRDDAINKIKSNSYNFRIPLRVTLTALKKDAWLRDLADAEYPLSKVSLRIPHGLRNKVLIDAMCSRNVPLPRAIWFTKCSLFSELMLIRKKGQAKSSGLQSGGASSNAVHEALERRWLQEWTQQVADYILKFSKEMRSVTSSELKKRYYDRMNYLISYVLMLYIEELVEKSFFLSLILRLLREDHIVGSLSIIQLTELARAEMEEESGVLHRILGGRSIDFGQLSMALTIIRVFWNDLIAESFLCKHLCESLLLNHFIVSKLPIEGKHPEIKLAKSGHIKDDCLSILSGMIEEIFHKSSSSFIIPSSWIVLGDTLQNIIKASASFNNQSQRQALEKVLALLNFRNESLMVNCQDSSSTGLSDDLKSQKLSFQHTAIHRSYDDILRLIEQLDRHKFRQAFNMSIWRSPVTSISPLRVKLKTVIFWCVSSYREMGPSCEFLLIACNAIKSRLLHIRGKTWAHLRNEFENEILECIFCLADVPATEISMKNLYVLFNELYQLKVITISAYLRKLIASGIFFLSPGSQNDKIVDDLGSQCHFHLLLLQNLPVLNNRQCDHILKKWKGTEAHFINTFNNAIEFLREGFLDKIMSNEIGHVDVSVFDHIKDLSVGLQFLVMNWFTSELKSSISKSSKLVHITPDVIAAVYDLFLLASNLTAFFKVFVRFILKNENKVMIFYMDSLYFIGRLVLKHSELLNFIAGSFTDSTPVSHDIFKLIVQDYKDLMSRECDMFHFRPIWEHIYRQVRRPLNDHLSPYNEAMNGKDIYHNMDSSFVESNTKSLKDFLDDSLDIELLLEELEFLKSREQKMLTKEEVTEKVDELQEEFPTMKNVLNYSATSSQARFLLGMVDAHMEEKNEIQLFKLLSNLQRGAINSTPSPLGLAFAEIFREQSSSSEGLSLLEPILRFTLGFDLLSCNSIIELVEKGELKQIDRKALTHHIFFGGVSRKPSSGYLSILFESVREKYKMDNYGLFVETLVKSIIPYQVGIDENEVLKAIIDDPTKAGHYIAENLSGSEILDLTSRLLGIVTPIYKPSDIDRLAPIINEFNLPVVQMILSIIVTDASDVDGILDTLIKSLKFFLDSSNSYFGELFNLCDSKVKLSVFNRMELLFLELASSLDLSNLQDANKCHIAIFQDFFRKINDSFIDKIETSTSQFNNFLTFLVGFIPVIRDVEGPGVVIVLEIILTFLRILIVRNTSLIDTMVQTDLQHFEFISQLVKLLNSKFMAENDERLSILLYDLLQLLKNSLTQRLTFKAEDDESAAITSPTPQNKMSDEVTTAVTNLSNQAADNERSYRPHKESIATLQSLLDLPEPSPHINRFRGQEATTDCVISLDTKELRSDGDVRILNQESLVLSSNHESAAFESPFGEIQRDSITAPFSIPSIQLVEETGSGVNDGCINLALFRAYTTRENDP